MRHIKQPWLTICAVGILSLTACTTQTKAVRFSPVEVPASFKESTNNAGWIEVNPADHEARGAWWVVFNDRVLNELCEQVSAQNTNVQLAMARLSQSEALNAEASATRWPQLNLNGAATHQSGPLINAAGGSGNLYTVSGSLTYELDLFGKLKGGVEASAFDKQAKEALLTSIVLRMQSEVAEQYLKIRAMDEEKQILETSVSLYTQVIAVNKKRFQQGSISELELLRNQNELLVQQAVIQEITRQRALSEHQLALLIGLPASQFSLVPTTWIATLPTIPAGIPASVLARRPDIAAAQKSVLAAQAKLGVAKKAWFPNFTLTGSNGFVSPTVGSLFGMSMRAWGIGLLLNLPVFDGGKRQAQADFANAEWEATIVMHRERVLTAIKEVEDQLVALQTLKEESAMQGRAIGLTNKTVSMAESGYRAGMASQLEVLEAKRTQLSQQRKQVQLKFAQYQATVGMIRAIGGAWVDVEAP